MVRSKQLFNNRFKQVGPGGWHCPCCGPAPKDRKKAIRRLKRGPFKRFLDKLVREDDE